MTTLDPNLLLAIPMLPLLAAIVAGLFGRAVGRTGAHAVTIAAVGASLLLSAYVAWQVFSGRAGVFNDAVYTWLVSDGIRMEVGFLIDPLSALMMVVVTFVSFCVHVYTIGYMHEDAGYQRFFAYISLFTFAMLMLVMSNNFLQLFFGWEAVGVVSYLLIGFWYTRPSAIFANLKAFLVNRVGDFGFVLGIAAIVYYTGSLDYRDAFAAAPRLESEAFALSAGWSVSALTLICLGLFVGAMGKSAQVPLHVWLPDSMEGPTPISALIHAATMVTAGIFMVARMSPIFEHSETALSFVLVIGATTALFMGFLGIVNNDIKRVVAYSTLSQLGYMTVALGVSAYSVAMFHLMTHAFFKALLFLAAGSVIIGMHHEQDMRRMGGLARHMPITAITCWIGALALIGTPFFSGFYSKDLIIESVHESQRWGATYAYWCVTLGVFVTALYTFRMIFMTFHGEARWNEEPHAAAEHAPAQPAAAAPLARAEAASLEHAGAPATVGHAHIASQEPPVAMDAHLDAHASADHADSRPQGSHHGGYAHGQGAEHGHDHGHDHGHGGGTPHESPWVVTLPLILLAVPSIIVGALTVQPLLFGGAFGDSIRVLERNDVVGELGREYPGWFAFAVESVAHPTLWLAVGGVLVAWLMFLKAPGLAATASRVFAPLRGLFENKYYFDWFNERVLAAGGRWLGRTFWKGGDEFLIDDGVVNGSAGIVGTFAGMLRRVQTGYLYSYAFWMVIGLAAMLGWFLLRA